MEERDNWTINKAVQLAHKSLFDHLVAGNKDHPLAASPQAENWSILLGKLHLKISYFSRGETCKNI